MIFKENTWRKSESDVAKSLDRAHQMISSPLSYNNEQSMQSAIRLAYIYADSFYTIISECPAGDGYADLAFIPYKPNVPAMIIELKIKGTAKSALEQIKDKRYHAGFEKWQGNTLLVGICYDKKTKKHECKIETA